MADQTKKKDNTKTTSLSIRMDDKTKKMIEKKAEKLDKSTSAYALNCILAGMNQKEDRKRNAEMAVICQELCNHVEEKYGDDEIMEEWIERLWELLL